jgi:hypothetical protein
MTMPTTRRSACLEFSLVWLALVALLPIAGRPADYTVNGWKIGVSVTPDTPSIMLGEPTWLSFKVENFSEENLQIIVGGDYRNEYGRPNSFKIRVTDENGRAVPQPVVKFEFGGMIGPQLLLAKSNYIFRLFVSDWATFDRPGRYTFECARPLQLIKSTKDTASWLNTPGVDVSAKTELTVTPSNFVRIGEVIDKLGTEVLAAKDPAASSARKALASLHDDRVLIIWLKSQEQTTSDAKFHAYTALAEYPAAEAVAALKRGVDLKGDDLPNCCTTAKVAEDLAKNVRVAAAHALAKNTNPEARKFLLARRHMGDDELRLTVVHMLGREKTDESSKILSEMAADPAEIVSAEAARYLKERSFTKPTPDQNQK